MEFHDHDPSSLCGNPEAFLAQLKLLIGVNYMERKRTGGSSGTCHTNKTFFDMLTLSGSLPRRSNAALWLEDKNSLEWHWFYINADDGRCVSNTYSQPVIGGKFTTGDIKRSHNTLPTKQLFQVYPVMIDFVFIKPLSALILQNINASTLFPFSVVPVATQVELSQIRDMKQFLADLDKTISNKQRKFEFCRFYSNMYCNYTDVEHPVGCHQDTFGKDKFGKKKPPGLENKMCLVDKSRNGPGRGGSNDGYVYAILDWPGGKQKTRNVWKNPENRDLPHGMNQYGGEGARMNHDIRVLFYNANPELQGEMVLFYNANPELHGELDNPNGDRTGRGARGARRGRGKGARAARGGGRGHRRGGRERYRSR